MLIFFPYGTDAPKYHYPIVTSVVIALNLIVFVLTGMGDYQDYRWLILNYGEINPLQWVTAAFMHADWAHVLGNMVFLWVFGQVVEGKTGNWQFSAIYLGLALVFGAVVQVSMFLFFGGEGGALGASGVIYALMAVSLVWAPDNEIHCAGYVGYWSLRGRMIEFEVPILGFAAFYGFLQLIGVIWLDFEVSSELGHLLGLAIGFPIGVLMLQRGWVDCEGWDFFSRYFSPINPKDAVAEMSETPKAPTLVSPISVACAEPEWFDSLASRGTLVSAIEAGDCDAARAWFEQAADTGDVAALSDQDLASYVRLFEQAKRYVDCLPALVVLTDRGGVTGQMATLRIAKIQLLVRRDPEAARRALDRIGTPVNDAVTQRVRDLGRRIELAEC